MRKTGEKERRRGRIQALAMAYRDGQLGLDRDERNFRFHLVETAHALKHPALKP